jgi:alpha-L-fucosidase
MKPNPPALVLLLLPLVAATTMAPAAGRDPGRPRSQKAAAVAPAPLLPVPTRRQIEWQALEFYAFAHFGMNTFTDREWGDGREDPRLFNPGALDARQWVRAFKDAGMAMVILTAKHHDGFCLWPSRYTDHSVKSSPWRGGRGDLVREVSDACREYGLEFGIYLSPWDRHEPSYGDSPRYNDFYVNQLTELLTSYGPIAVAWFDGACGEGPNGKRQEYDWARYRATVRKLQPDAVMFSDAGPDVRWIGNEQGVANETNWSTFNLAGMGVGANNPGQTEGHLGGTDWVPAEVDVSIRPGWFYHPAQDGTVKPLERLIDIYFTSVGRNGSLLLNVPPDTRGLIHENDVARLRELRQALDRIFETDLALKAIATADSVRGASAEFSARRAIDGSTSTYWATDDGVTSATLEVDLGAEKDFDVVLVREHVPLGQRVESFAIEAWQDGQWKQVGSGTTVGNKRLLRIPRTRARLVRLVIRKARACPTISTFGLFLSEGGARASATATSPTRRLSPDGRPAAFRPSGAS